MMILVFCEIKRSLLDFFQDVTWQFRPVLALSDPFGVDVPLNFDITQSLQNDYCRYSCYQTFRQLLTTDVPLLKDTVYRL